MLGGIGWSGSGGGGGGGAPAAATYWVTTADAGLPNAVVVPIPASTRIPFSNGTTLTSSADLTWSANDNLLVGTTSDVASTRLRVGISKTVASAAGAVWNGVDVIASTLTLSGSTNVTTSTGVNANVLRAPTITAGSALTVSFAATLAIGGPPVQAGSATITNTFPLWVQSGTSVFDGTVQLGRTGDGNTGNRDLIIRTNGRGIRFRLNDTTGILALAADPDINGVTMIATTFAGAITINNNVNIAFDTGAGSKIGTATTQKFAFWNATPIAQPAAVADAAGGATVDAEARTAINSLLARMRSTGLIAT